MTLFSFSRGAPDELLASRTLIQSALTVGPRPRRRHHEAGGAVVGDPVGIDERDLQPVLAGLEAPRRAESGGQTLGASFVRRLAAVEHEVSPPQVPAVPRQHRGAGL